MNQIKVELLDSMGDDLTISNSARVSFDKWKEELDDKDVRLIDFLARERHVTPFRHNALQIRATAPIWLARQLGKHQAGLSWNEVSRRYVDTPPEFYLVDEVRARPDDSIKQGSGSVMKGDAGDVALAEIDKAHKQAAATYQKLLEMGVAPETARGVLPQDMLTSWIWTGNLLAFYHCYKLRIDSHAQLEAQYFAKKLGEILEARFPNSFAALKNN